MPQFRTSSWTPQTLQSCRDELDNMFREAVGYGNGTRMDPRAIQRLDADRVDIAETIVNLIQEEVVNIDPLPLLVDQVTGDIRNNYIWQEMDGALRVVDRSYGSKPLSQRLTFKEYSMRTSMKEVAVELPLEEVFSGRLTPSIAAQEMAIAITRYRVSMLLDAFDAAIPSGDDRTGLSGYELRYTCTGGKLTQAELDKALDGLMDEGESPTVFGRYIALFPAMRAFTNSAGVSGLNEQTQQEFFQRGVVGQYHGANLLVLRDPFAKRSADHLIPSNKVWVASGTKGAIFMNKPVSFLNWAMTDARTATFGTGIRLEDGLLVTDPYRYRILTITA